MEQKNTAGQAGGAAYARYHFLIVCLHWLMALAFAFMLGSGFAMTSFVEDASLKFQMYQWHKSAGVLLLIAFFVRLFVRFVTRVPALPAALPGWEVAIAKAGHYSLYLLMFLLPLSGWLMVSASVYGLPTIVFGLFEWPHIPGVQANEGIHGIAHEVHEIGAWLFLALIAAHVFATLKHFLKDRLNLLPRMWFGKGDIK